MRRALLATLFAKILFILTASLGYSQNQPRGYIQNMNGEKCWYNQSTQTEKYFHSLEANTATLLFDDPKCMAGAGLEGDVNRMMIGNIVTGPYGQSDARFKTRSQELFESSLLQKRGLCIQSATYPTLGVVIEFIEADNYITSVKHAMSVQGCKK